MILLVRIMFVYAIVILKPCILCIFDLLLRDSFLNKCVSNRKSLIQLLFCTETNRTVHFKIY